MTAVAGEVDATAETAIHHSKQAIRVLAPDFGAAANESRRKWLEVHGDDSTQRTIADDQASRAYEIAERAALSHFGAPILLWAACADHIRGKSGVDRQIAMGMGFAVTGLLHDPAESFDPRAASDEVIRSPFQRR